MDYLQYFDIFDEIDREEPPRKRKLYKKRLDPFTLQDKEFRMKHRFSKVCMRKIVDLVQRDIKLQASGGGLSVELQVCTALRTWARQEVQDDAADIHGLSQQSITNIWKNSSWNIWPKNSSCFGKICDVFNNIVAINELLNNKLTNDDLIGNCLKGQLMDENGPVLGSRSFHSDADGSKRYFMTERIFPRQIYEIAVACHLRWTETQQTLRRQGVSFMPSPITIVCVWCLRSLANTHRHSILDGPERNEIIARIHPREGKKGKKLDVWRIELGCIAFFAELEPSVTVTEQNLADRVRYILRSNIFGDTELERLRREAIPSSNGNATAGMRRH
ncbi:unnamed protein product [Parnassius apollo]|uniref:(apollo) hypothetical protein n=1 Tax=Parnassius apollo TaxID=110799 RepID=A0A8S3W101_PARAO|nr:unnamed protein product [Parnassius apollo]